MFDLNDKQKHEVADIMANTVRAMAKAMGKNGKDGDVMDVMQLIMAQVTLAVLVAGVPLPAVMGVVMDCNRIAQSPEAQRLAEMALRGTTGGTTH